MSSAPPPSPTYPILNGNTFNNDFFTNTTGNLSLENAFKFFLRLTGGTISGSLAILQNLNVSGNTYLQDFYLNNIKVNSTATELNYLSSVVLGVAQANKALTLNATSNISGINILSANELTALNGANVEGGHLTLSASSHLKINSLSDASATTNASIYTKGGVYIEKSLTALQNINSNTLSTNNITLNGTLITASANELNYNDITITGTAEASKTLVVDANRDISNIRNLIATNLTGTLQTASQPNITSIGTLTSLSTNSITLNGTLITASANELNYNDISTIGIAEASKTLVVDVNRDISNIRNLTATNLIGTLQTSSQPNITSVGTLTGLSTNNITLNGTLITASANELNYNDITITGTAEANKTLVVDANRDISNIRNLIATNLTGTLQTASQPNITSIGTLTSLSTNSITLNGTLITASANELNYNDISTIGVAEANKALVVDSSRDISNIRNLNISQLNSEDFRLTKTLVSGTLIFGNKTDIFAGTLYKFGTLSNDDFLIMANDNQSGLYIKTNGRIGVRENNPDYELDVDGSIGFTGSLYFNGTQLTASVSELNVLNGLTATTTELNYVDTNAGTAQASKALILDASRNITNINNISSTGIISNTFINDTTTPLVFQTWTNDLTTDMICQLQMSNVGINFGSASNHPLRFITNNTQRMWINTTGRVGIGRDPTLTYGLDISNGVVNIESTNNNILRINNTSTTGRSNILFVSGRTWELGARGSGDSFANSFYLWDSTASNMRFFIDSTGNVSFGGTSSSYKLDVVGSLNATTLNINGSSITATATELNYNDVATIGIAEASKALILDSSRNITNINNISSTGIISNVIANNTTTFTDYQTWTNDLTTDIICKLQMNNAKVNFGLTSNNSFGFFTNNIERLLINSSGNISIGNTNNTYSLDVSGDINASGNIRINGTALPTSGDFSKISGITDGTATANKALVVDVNRDITNIRNLTATNLTGVLQTASQPNITSVGTLTSLSTGNITLNGTLITSTATELNYLDITTIGTAEASKALVVDANRDITNVRNANFTSLTMNTSAVSRPLVMLNSTLASGSNISFTLGRSSASNQQGEITFAYSSTANQSRLSLGHFGNPNMLNVLSDGKVGININLPVYQLDVNGSLNTTSLNINSSAVTATASELNYNDLTAIGTAEASKSLVVNSNRDIYNINNLGVNDIDLTNNSGLTEKSLLQKNSQSNGNGIEIYDTQLHSVANPCLNILPANSEYPIYMNFYNINRGNFRFYIENLSNGLGGGLNCKYLRSVNSALHSNNINFRSPNDNIQMTINDYNTTNPNLIFHPSNASNDTIPNWSNFKAIFCEGVLMKKSLMLSTSTSGSLDPSSQCCITGTSTYVDGSYNKVLRLLGANATPVEFQIQCHSGTNATTTNPVFLGTISNNDLRIGTNNSTRMIIDNTGRVGIGTNTPTTGLDVAIAENNVTTTTNVAINTYSYNIATNTNTNLGGGPVTVAMCGRFRGSIWVQDKLYATSDKRFKTDIKQLDFSLEHYNKLNPVSYKWKNSDKNTLGLIAQEVKNICGESINLIENKNMKKESEDDPEGYQYTLDYNCINIMNVVAIKKLIEKNNKLEQRLYKLEKFISELNIVEE